MEEKRKKKVAALTPVKDASREKMGKACWRLSIPASFSESGKREQRFYPSYKKALAAASEIKLGKVAVDAGVVELTQAQAVDALSALDALGSTGISLVDACRLVKRMYESGLGDISEMEHAFKLGADQIRHEKKSPSWSEAAWEMVRVKEKITRRRESTLRQIRYMIRRMEKRCPDFCMRPVGSITGEECRMTFAKAFDLPIQQDKARVVFSGVWTLAIKRGWALSNPTRMLDALKTQEREIRALTPEEVERLLLACRPPLEGDSCQLDLTSIQPAAAILVFAGIRPEELMRLTWEDVSFEDGVITVRAAASKTGGARHVTICKALRAWLSLVSEDKRRGAIVQEYWRSRWEAARKRAGWGKEKPWPKDVLRHTFASYHAKTYADFGKLQMEMGHRSAELLRNRYTNMTGLTKEKAARFWKLLPGP